MVCAVCLSIFWMLHKPSAILQNVRQDLPKPRGISKCSMHDTNNSNGDNGSCWDRISFSRCKEMTSPFKMTDWWDQCMKSMYTTQYTCICGMWDDIMWWIRQLRYSTGNIKYCQLNSHMKHYMHRISLVSTQWYFSIFSRSCSNDNTNKSQTQLKLISPGTKRSSFRRRCFEMHFREWKVLNFDWNST